MTIEPEAVYFFDTSGLFQTFNSASYMLVFLEFGLKSILSPVYGLIPPQAVGHTNRGWIAQYDQIG